jgi:hypothetical protein
MSAVTQALAPRTPLGTDRRTIPFDYQMYLAVFDEKKPDRSLVGQVLTTTTTVSIEAAFVAMSIGYGFAPRVRTFPFGPTVTVDTAPANLSFSDILTSLARSLGESRAAAGGEILLTTGVTPVNLGPRTKQVLLSGIEINPARADRLLLALSDGDTLKSSEIASLFEASEPSPERVQFLYALSDKGTGRNFQSEPLLNTAGLGTIDGDRPFRHFATPIVFPPRSTIQIDVIPKTEFHGELYFTLHGYKVLGGSGTPTGRRLRPPAGRSRRP